MDRDEMFEAAQRVLLHFADNQTPEWKRIRKELQWTIFWPLAKAVFLFWLACVAILMMAAT